MYFSKLEGCKPTVSNFKLNKYIWELLTEFATFIQTKKSIPYTQLVGDLSSAIMKLGKLRLNAMASKGFNDTSESDAVCIPSLVFRYILHAIKFENAIVGKAMTMLYREILLGYEAEHTIAKVYIGTRGLFMGSTRKFYQYRGESFSQKIGLSVLE